MLHMLVTVSCFIALGMQRIQSNYSVPLSQDRTSTSSSITSPNKRFTTLSTQHNKNLGGANLMIDNMATLVASNVNPQKLGTRPTKTSSKSLIPKWLRNNQGIHMCLLVINSQI